MSKLAVVLQVIIVIMLAIIIALVIYYGTNSPKPVKSRMPATSSLFSSSRHVVLLRLVDQDSLRSWRRTSIEPTLS